MSDLRGQFTLTQFADPMRGVCYDPATLFAGMSLSKGLMIGGTILSTVGQIQAGNVQKSAANFQAAQLEQQADTERATAQRRASEQRRQKDFAISRARAVGAASGGGVDFEMIGDLEEEGELRAGYAIWEGEERAKGRQMQASAARLEGSQSKKASRFKAGRTLLSGGSSFLEKYG